MSGAGIMTFIVDDEPVARRRLAHLLKRMPDIELGGVFDSADAALTQAQHNAPQLLLLDVRMPERDGFDMVDSLRRAGITPYVIFVTAHADRPLEAFEVGAIDYLLKPFDEPRFVRAVERATALIRARREASEALAPPAASAPAERACSRLLLSERGKVVVLATRDIEFVQAAIKNVRIHAGGRCYVFRQTLRELEARLDPACFVRIHRSVLVNVEYITEMNALFHGDYELVLRRGTRLTLSRRYRDRLRPHILQQKL
jgi:two-component system, LytTR family, response regulator